MQSGKFSFFFFRGREERERREEREGERREREQGSSGGRQKKEYQIASKSPSHKTSRQRSLPLTFSTTGHSPLYAAPTPHAVR